MGCSSVAVCCLWLAGLVAMVQGNCGPPPPAVGQSILEKETDEESFDVGSTVKYKCDDRKGYVKVRNKQDSITCLEDSWSTIEDDFCEPGCSAPPRLEFGEPMEKYLAVQSFAVESKVIYKCRPGYVPKPRSNPRPSIQCRESLKWSEIQEFCHRKDCGNPGEPLNGVVELATGEYNSPDTRFGSIATFSCLTGFRLIGRRTRMCEASGWTNTVPVCEPVQCPDPPDIANGKHSGYNQDHFLYLSGVTYSCNAGYFELRGERMIYCTENGDWSHPAPECKDRRCPEPAVENGRKVSGFKSLYVINDVVEFRCNAGFRTKDTQRIQCGEDNVWDPQAPVCEPVVCGPPPAIENGTHDGIDRAVFNFRERVTYSCNSDDLSLIGEDTIQCVGEGDWSERKAVWRGHEEYRRDHGEPAPKCKAVHCETPPFSNGRMQSNAQEPYRYKTTISFECNLHFTLMGAPVVTCSEDSTWFPTVPFCKDLRCPTPAVANGAFTSRNSHPFVLYNEVLVKCEEGFVPDVQTRIICKEDNKWDPSPPVCQPIMCGRPPAIAQGTHNGMNRKEFGYREAVVYRCDSDDLSLIGEETIKCVGVDSWSPLPPICKDVVCPDLVLPDGNTTSEFRSPFKYGHSVMFQCHQNFRLLGEQVSTCGQDNKWDPPVPSCERTTCREPVVKNGTVKIVRQSREGTSYKPGRRVDVVCDNGYDLVGAKQITCKDDLNWKPSIPTCKPNRCPKPDIEHGSIIDKRGKLKLEKWYKMNDKIVIKCEPNYILNGTASEIQCENNFQWSSLPTCEPVICFEPKVENGTIFPTQNVTGELAAKKAYRVSDKAKVNCEDGYILEGANEIECQNDSHWSPLPTCQLVHCDEPQVNNGSVICKNTVMPKSGPGYHLSDNITFECDNGFIMNGTRTIQCREDSKWSALPTCLPDKRAGVAASCPPRFLPLPLPDLQPKELHKDTIINSSSKEICDSVFNSTDKNWQQMNSEDQYTHLQMIKLCSEISELKAKDEANVKVKD